MTQTVEHIDARNGPPRVRKVGGESAFSGMREWGYNIPVAAIGAGVMFHDRRSKGPPMALLAHLTSNETVIALGIYLMGVISGVLLAWAARARGGSNR